MPRGLLTVDEREREREILLKVRLGFSDDGARAILRGYNGN